MATVFQSLTTADYWLMIVSSIAVGYIVKELSPTALIDCLLRAGLLAYAVCLPGLAITGFGPLTTNILFDGVLSLGIAALYLACLQAPSRGLQLFAFSGPAAMMVFVAYRAAEIGIGGAEAIAALFPLACIVWSLPMFFWLSRFVRQDAPVVSAQLST